MITVEKLQTWLKDGESEHLEFKTSFGQDTIETLVAFANTKGGIVLIGVSDDNEIKGVTLAKESINQWINEIKSKTVPQLIPDVEIVEAEGKTLVYMFAPEYPIKPVACKGRYYKRSGNTNQQLSIQDVIHIHLQSLNSSWDSFPDSTHSVDDISLEKVLSSIEKMKGNGISITEDPVSFLVKHDLLRDDKLTYAAYLLFKKQDSFITTIELGRFQDETTIKDSARTKADILTQIEQVLDFVRKHTNKEIVITGEAQNTQKWQYPMEAIREIVINMVIHRDYHLSSDSIVKIFNNKIEFYNPGRLPESISILDLLSNNYKSTPRNKLIADFCKDLGIFEKYGSGIRRIIEYFNKENLPAPEFRNISEGFMVTVYSEKVNKKEDGDEVTPPITPPITELEQKIIDMVGLKSTITRKELAEILEVGMDTVKKYLEKLKHKGVLMRIGNNRSGYWKIKDS